MALVNGHKLTDRRGRKRPLLNIANIINITNLWDQSFGSIVNQSESEPNELPPPLLTVMIKICNDKKFDGLFFLLFPALMIY
jgi:hypothetical protein